ncbi:MAG: aminotransferase class III-fold pyridoxal phosphate-dependent enzyme [Chloroflexota bacterium]
MANPSSKQNQVTQIIRESLFDLSGFEIDGESAATSFLELGFDSLFLIQFSTSIKQELGVQVSFRQMLEEMPTFSKLVEHIVSELPDDALPAAQNDEPAISLETNAAPNNEGTMPLYEFNEFVAGIHNGSSVATTPSAQGPEGGEHNGIPNGIEQAASNGTSTLQTDLPASANWPPTPSTQPTLPPQFADGVGPTPAAAHTTGIEAVLAQQLQVMSMQLAALSAQSFALPKPQSFVPMQQPQIPSAPTQASRVRTEQHSLKLSPNSGSAASSPSHSKSRHSTNGQISAKASLQNGTHPPAENKGDADPKTSQEMKPFGAIARIQTKKGEELELQQQQWLEQFIAEYNKMTAESKKFTAKWQKYHADPRVVSGFKSKIKELIYPIVASRTNGCRIWDLDGNEFVDALNGFGSNFFGYANPDITQAVVDQMWRGVEIGPQCPLTGEAAKLICELTGMERVGFCNTGSEAVMGAMRIARTVTGRRTIVIFSGSYHGIFDEVIVRSVPGLRSMPAAPGIMPSTVENVLVLEYGTEESLQIIRERIDELAAVMVEPVQSRRPEFQPREFLQELRQITAENDVPFIFDEVITGFRTGPGGAQEFFGIQADIATYGKVVGGGMHIGVVAGKAKYMDALDGGPWQYGDDSVPEIGVTYFAGTFVRHPASIAACLAALRILKDEGPALQSRVNGQTAYLVSELNNFFRDRGVPLETTYFSSLWRMTYTENVPYGELLFYLIRTKGVHIYDGFPCFITMAHTDEDVDIILDAVKESVISLQEAGFLPRNSEEVAQTDFFVTAS